LSYVRGSKISARLLNPLLLAGQWQGGTAEASAALIGEASMKTLAPDARQAAR